MVRKIKAKAILRLNDQGLSGRAIARSLGIARQSVAEVLAASAAAGIAYPDVEAKPDDECVCSIEVRPMRHNFPVRKSGRN